MSSQILFQDSRREPVQNEPTLTSLYPIPNYHCEGPLLPSSNFRARRRHPCSTPVLTLSSAAPCFPPLFFSRFSGPLGRIPPRYPRPPEPFVPVASCGPRGRCADFPLRRSVNVVHPHSHCQAPRPCPALFFFAFPCTPPPHCPAVTVAVARKNIYRNGISLSRTVSKKAIIKALFRRPG
jgi:hypothetical protein